MHIVAPAAHMSVEDIAGIVNDKLHLGVPAEAQAILKGIRAYLRPIFVSAVVGVTGGNIGIAETGTVVVETNEGNAGLVSSAPRVHIVLIGREKRDRAGRRLGHLVDRERGPRSVGSPPQQHDLRVVRSSGVVVEARLGGDVDRVSQHLDVHVIV